MRKFRLTCFSKFFLLSILSLHLPVFAVAPTQQAILFLSGEHYTDPYISTFLSAFNRSLKNTSQSSFVVYPETLDLTRLSSQAHRDRLHDLLQEKYRNVEFKAIVAIGSSALQYLLESQSLWPHTPIIFSGVSQSKLSKLSLPPNVTGNTTGIVLADTVDLAKSLFPNTKRLVLLGNTPEKDNYRPFFAADLATLYEKIEFIDLRSKPLKEILQEVTLLPDDAVIYYTGLSEDSTGHKFASFDALQSIIQVANRPTLVDNAIFVGSGVVGGTVLDPTLQATETARQTLLLMEGKEAAAMPIASAQLRPLFDSRKIEQWGIDRASLPPQSEIRFYESPVWEQYRWPLIGIFAALVLQSVLVTALLVERRRRTRAESESRRRLADIAHLNRTTTATVFSAAIAHELNQPLAAILSNAEAAQIFLQMDPPAIKDVQDILADICLDDRRASDLIQRMRDLLKKSESAVQSVSLNDVVKQTLKVLAGEAKTRNVMLTAHLSYHHLIVFVDSVQLQQVIINLVVNSMDAMTEMTDTNRMIAIRTAMIGSSAEVCVSDSGPGFDSHLERVFESFFTTKAQGMGLGLSIASEIIQAHGGQIQAENNPDGGAIVRFRLPLQMTTES